MVTALPVALPDDQADRLCAVFDAHHDRLYRLARRLVRSADDALDLMQETFLKAAARWHLAMGRRDLARILKPQIGDTDAER